MADFVENNGVYSSGEGRGFEEDPLEEFFKPSNQMNRDEGSGYGQGVYGDVKSKITQLGSTLFNF